MVHSHLSTLDTLTAMTSSYSTNSPPPLLQHCPSLAVSESTITNNTPLQTSSAIPADPSLAQTMSSEIYHAGLQSYSTAALPNSATAQFSPVPSNFKKLQLNALSFLTTLSPSPAPVVPCVDHRKYRSQSSPWYHSAHLFLFLIFIPLAFIEPHRLKQQPSGRSKGLAQSFVS